MSRTIAGLVIGLVVTLGSAAAADDAPDQSKGTVEFRLAEPEPTGELKPAIVAETDRTIYLHPESFLSLDDVESVCFHKSTTGTVSIGLNMTEDGARKLSEASRAHIGKPIAVLVSGRVISAPTVRAEMSRRARIDGRFSQEELLAFFSAFVLGGQSEATR